MAVPVLTLKDIYGFTSGSVFPCSLSCWSAGWWEDPARPSRHDSQFLMNFWVFTGWFSWVFTLFLFFLFLKPRSVLNWISQPPECWNYSLGHHSWLSALSQVSSVSTSYTEVQKQVCWGRMGQPREMGMTCLGIPRRQRSKQWISVLVKLLKSHSKTEHPIQRAPNTT